MTDIAQAPKRRLWYLHGKAYDLVPLLKWHPGGRDVLLACEGRECTDIFENSHALSAKNVRSLIHRYEVRDAPAGPKPAGFTYETDGFYAELARRVKVYIAGQGGNYKATWMYWIRLYMLLAFYVTMMYFSVIRGSILSAGIAGSLWMMFLFYGGLHDASHQALSKRPWVNKFWSTLTSHWGFWHHELWLQHHVYGHHSFTGIAHLDPDISHFPEWFRKSRDMKLEPMHAKQSWTYVLIHLILPNQYIAHLYAYWVTRITRSNILFAMPVHLTVKLFDVLPWSLEMLSFATNVILPMTRFSVLHALALIATHYTMSGILYFLIVAPNHDTDATDKYAGVLADWGEHQVRHSSNFSNGNKILTMFFGGMNYQIEHHLFPTMCNVHYASIGRITKQLCAERNIPYAHFKSLPHAVMGVMRNMRNLGREE